MASEAKERRVALLVDLENVAGLPLRRVFEVAASEGQVIVRRVYGGFHEVAARKQDLQDLAFDQSALFNNTDRKKNGADIFLAIEAMDLLHRDVVDVFVVATGDSDYAKLARRLREGGKRVVGIGDAQPAKVLVQSCDRYEVVEPGVPEPAKPAPGAAHPAKPRAVLVEARRPLPEEIRAVVWTAIRSALPEEGQADGARLHNAILRLDPSFDYSQYAKNFRLFLLEHFPELEVGVNEGGTMLARLRPARAAEA